LVPDPSKHRGVVAKSGVQLVVAKHLARIHIYGCAKGKGCGSPTPHVSPYFTTRSRGLAGHSGAGTCLLA
jgi:hypothetical protein